MKKALLAALAIVIFHTAALAQQDPRLVGLDTFIEKTLKQLDAVGCAVAIVEKDKIILTKGFGYRDLDNKKAVSASTQFAIGSCTKAIQASIHGQVGQSRVFFHRTTYR